MKNLNFIYHLFYVLATNQNISQCHEGKLSVSACPPMSADLPPATVAIDQLLRVPIGLVAARGLEASFLSFPRAISEHEEGVQGFLAAGCSPLMILKELPRSPPSRPAGLL